MKKLSPNQKRSYLKNKAPVENLCITKCSEKVKNKKSHFLLFSIVFCLSKIVILHRIMKTNNFHPGL